MFGQTNNLMQSCFFFILVFTMSMVSVTEVACSAMNWINCVICFSEAVLTPFVVGKHCHKGLHLFCHITNSNNSCVYEAFCNKFVKSFLLLHSLKNFLVARLCSRQQRQLCTRRGEMLICRIQVSRIVRSNLREPFIATFL